MKKFVVVILNFNTAEQTINMVESIQRNKNTLSNINIVIVDNASTDGSGKYLKNNYSNDKQVHVIENLENNGFAAGNNIGYQYGRKANPNFIILSNSDVLIKEERFFDNISKVYDDEKFAVLGPDVFNPNTNIHQSPLYYDKKVDNKYIIRRKAFLRVNQLKNILSFLFPKLMAKVIKANKLKNERERNHSKQHTDVAIHGSFMIFSKKYMEIFPKGICDATFMYGEEDILLYFCQAHKLKTVYNPKIQVLHFEGQSTLKANKNIYKAEKFKQKNMKKSMMILEKYINSGQKNW